MLSPVRWSLYRSRERLTILDLLAVLREQGSRRHGEVLEWIGKIPLWAAHGMFMFTNGRQLLC